MYTKIIITALFVVAKAWKQPNCFLSGQGHCEFILSYCANQEKIALCGQSLNCTHPLSNPAPSHMAWHVESLAQTYTVVLLGLWLNSIYCIHTVEYHAFERMWQLCMYRQSRISCIISEKRHKTVQLTVICILNTHAHTKHKPDHIQRISLEGTNKQIILVASANWTTGGEF